MTKTCVAGAGMIPFTKPSRSEDWYEIAETGIRPALDDIGTSYDKGQQAYLGHVHAASAASEPSLYRVGCSGNRIVNVKNNRSTGSTALNLARQAIKGDRAA